MIRLFGFSFYTEQLFYILPKTKKNNIAYIFDFEQKNLHDFLLGFIIFRFVSFKNIIKI